MPCETCIQALERGGQALHEMSYFHRDQLPPEPSRPLTWRELSEVLIALAGQLRLASRNESGR